MSVENVKVEGLFWFQMWCYIVVFILSFGLFNRLDDCKSELVRIAIHQREIVNELKIQNQNTTKVIKSLEFVSKIADRF